IRPNAMMQKSDVMPLFIHNRPSSDLSFPASVGSMNTRTTILLIWMSVTPIGSSPLMPQARAGIVHDFDVQVHQPYQNLSNLTIYQDLNAMRDANPAKFDHAHPLYGRLLTHPGFFNRIDARWHKNEARFAHYHPFLWRVLDGAEQWTKMQGQPAPGNNNNGE